VILLVEISGAGGLNRSVCREAKPLVAENDS